MKILFRNLSVYKIERLVICSIEQALYQAFVVIDGEERLVWENEKKCFVRRNLMKMRECFEPLGITDTVLRHESPYDEMIGLPSGPTANRLEVPLGQLPYPYTRQTKH